MRGVGVRWTVAMVALGLPLLAGSVALAATLGGFGGLGDGLGSFGPLVGRGW